MFGYSVMAIVLLYPKQGDLTGPKKDPQVDPARLIWGTRDEKGPSGVPQMSNQIVFFLDSSLHKIETWIFSLVWGQSENQFPRNNPWWAHCAPLGLIGLSTDFFEKTIWCDLHFYCIFDFEILFHNLLDLKDIFHFHNLNGTKFL